MTSKIVYENGVSYVRRPKRRQKRWNGIVERDIKSDIASDHR